MYCCLVTLDLQVLVGFLESHFVAKVAKWAHVLSENTMIAYGYPSALYALIMAGVCAIFSLPLAILY
jgi:ABC-type spermidine/putrescine transport system permease subunit I